MKTFLILALAFTALGSAAAKELAGGEFQWSWPHGAGAMMSAAGAPVAELSVVKVNGDGSGVPAKLQSRQTKGGRKIETWSLDEPAVDVVLEYSAVRSLPSTKINMQAVNRSDAKASACVAVEAKLKYPVNRAILFDFTKSPYVEFGYDEEDGIMAASWKAETDQNFRAGLYGFPNRTSVFNSWGTVELCSPADAAEQMYSTLYLPIVSLYDQNKGGLVAWCDPRSPIGFDGNRERLRLQHTFFLPAEKGSVDAGFEPGDGTGPWPYDLFFAYSKRPTWDKLYAGFYMASAPDLRGGVKAKSEPGIIALPRLTENYLPIFQQLGIKYAGGVSTTYAYVDGPTIEEMEWGRKHGIKSFARDETIAMLIELDVSPVPFWEPMWVWERYRSSIVKRRDGTDSTSGQGKYGNPSPRFPYGRDRLQAMKELFEQGYGGFYTDLYLSTVVADWGHPVDALPFYPMQRAFYEYLGAIGKETQKRGILHVINAPHPSSLVGKYADWMTFDTDAPIWLWCRAYGELTGINVQFWTNLQDTVPKLRSSMSDALAYGIVTGPYVVFGYLLPGNTPIPEEDKEKLLSLYESHYKTAYAIGRSRLVKGGSIGGRPGPFIYYRGDDGTGYITVQNLGKETREFLVSLELQALGLDKVHRLSYATWDINNGLSRPTALDGSIRSQKLKVEPGMTSVIILKNGAMGREMFSRFHSAADSLPIALSAAAPK